MLIDDEVVESSEEEHTHYCEMCGSTWSHQDVDCPGPRFTGYYGQAFDCPLCVEGE